MSSQTGLYLLGSCYDIVFNHHSAVSKFCIFLVTGSSRRKMKTINHDKALSVKLYLNRSLSAGACKYPIFLSGRFHRPIYFSLNLSRIQIPMGTSVTNCNHEHGLMSTCSREAALFNPKGCWCTLELAYFTAKISKNRLLCKNAVALACYGSRRLLGMGSWLEAIELE